MKKTKHILIVSQYFYPEPFRINDMAAEWVKRGYQVTVLTGIPNYPAGRFYDGYGYFRRRRETWNGVKIIRIPLIARGSGRGKFLTPVGLAANYLSFAASGFFWNLTADIAADCVFTFEVSPMTQALVGVWHAKKHHVPHYLYVQDLWPENVKTVAGVHHPALIRPMDWMVDYIYKNTDEIFTASPSFARAVCSRKVKVDKRKVHYWPQYAEDFYKPSRFSENEAEKPSRFSENKTAETADRNAVRRRAFKIAFTGNIGYAQGLDILPKAAALLKDENVTFVIVGDGRYKAQLKKEIMHYEARDRFILLPHQDAEKIPKILGACDAAFLSFMDTKLFEMTIPAKLQSYMACGMPVIASACGETKRIIESAGCGICTAIGDAGKLADGIRRLMKSDRQEMGRKSREYFEKHFDRKMLMDWFEQYLTQEKQEW